RRSDERCRVGWAESGIAVAEDLHQLFDLHRNAAADAVELVVIAEPAVRSGETIADAAGQAGVLADVAHDVGLGFGDPDVLAHAHTRDDGGGDECAAAAR